MLPERILKRDKNPYRAPISRCFTDGNNGLATRLFKEDKINEYGYFQIPAVNLLKKKVEKSNGVSLSAGDEMAIVGIVSMQLLHHHYLR